MTNFKQEQYNIKRLKPNIADVELNKCTHTIDEDEGDFKCWMCGQEIEQHLDCGKFVECAETIILQLESMKYVCNLTMSKKEFKEAKKYFDMIPLLKNIMNLYAICDKNITNLKELEETDNELDVVQEES